MNGWRLLWREIQIPSGIEVGPHYWACTFLGHVMLGAVFGFLPAIIVALVYWFFKERRDGRFRDGLIDASAVYLGALYSGPDWWPLLVFAACAVGITVARWE